MLDLSCLVIVLLCPTAVNMAQNDAGVYEQSKEIFYKGKLVGNEMLQCYILVEKAVSTFFGEQMNLLDRLGAEHWNIVKETVHLVWAYGQTGHQLEKRDLQGWNGTTMYQSFFRLDEKDKDFQVVVLSCFVFLGLSDQGIITVSCVVPGRLTICYRSVYG